jgi:hypothetical protein
MENENPDDFNYRPDMRVVRSARNFIQSLCEVYGSNQGMAVWDNIRSGLGEQIASDIFLGMLIGGGNIVVHQIGGLKIEAIKEVRSFTGMGLKESKDFVEEVIAGRPKTLDTCNMDQETVNRFCNAMNAIGCLVK